MHIVLFFTNLLGQFSICLFGSAADINTKSICCRAHCGIVKTSPQTFPHSFSEVMGEGGIIIDAKAFWGMFRILLARDSHPLCNVLRIKRSSRKHFLIHFPPRHAKYTHSHTQYTAVHTHTHTYIDSAHTRTHARPLNSCSCTWAPPFSLPRFPLPAAHVAANGSARRGLVRLPLRLRLSVCVFQIVWIYFVLFLFLWRLKLCLFRHFLFSS